MRTSSSRIKRLLVATDGGPASDAALRIAVQIAQRHGATVEVVGVFAPRTPPMTGCPQHPCESSDRTAAAELFQRVRQQVRERVPVRGNLQLRVGHPAWVIADMARNGGADLVLVGHTAVPKGEEEHWNSRHTAQQVAYSCDVPVLSVPPAAAGLPQAGVVVVDGTASRRAESFARALLGEGGTLHQTRAPVSRDVLHMCASLGADLVAVPVLGDDFVVRSLLGGGIADVLEHADRMVLLTPVRVQRRRMKTATALAASK